MEGKLAKKALSHAKMLCLILVGILAISLIRTDSDNLTYYFLFILNLVPLVTELLGRNR